MHGGTLKVALLYVGGVIGAGFASGQEIMQFFGCFGVRGLWGVVVATFLFIYLGVVIQTTAVRIEATSYREVLNYLLGRHLAPIADRLSQFMLVVGLGIMLAGSGAIFEQQLALPPALGVLILAILIMAIIWTGLTGVVAANAILVPLKLVLVTGVAILALFIRDPVSSSHAAAPAGLVGDSWIWAAVLYVSYNLVVPLAVLSTLGRHLTPAEARRGAVAGGILLGVAAGLVAAAVMVHYAQVWPYQVPLLYLATSVHPGIGMLFSLVIWLAVLTTGIANAHGFASRLALPNSTAYRLAGLGAVLAMLPVVFFDFASLVRFFYPLFGWFGLLLVAALLARAVTQSFGDRGLKMLK